MANFRNLGESPSVDDAPFPGWADETIRIVEEAIRSAWKSVLSDGSIDVKTENEVAITDALQQHLVRLLNLETVEGFNSDVFPPPTRDSSVSDFSGKYLEKRPDLTIYCQHVRPVSIHRAFFFECKPIGNIGIYLGANGLERFLDGRYAWAMPHAGMIGYVQKRRKPKDAESLLNSNLNKDSSVFTNLIVNGSLAKDPVVITEHPRHFQLRNGRTPGSIQIRHLWLDSDG
jgi:hypothetical protein